MNFKHEDRLRDQVIAQLKAADQQIWQRYPLPWTHPSFKSAPVAARNILALFPHAQHVLVGRDVCLRHMKEAVLDDNRTLLMPTYSLGQIVHVPRSALYGPDLKRKRALCINPLPAGCVPYNGPVELIVLACLGFTPFSTRPYSLELEVTASVMENLYMGYSITPAVSRDVPVVVMAADEQEVVGWPESALAMYEAHTVITPTRGIVLGSGEQVVFGANNVGARVDAGVDGRTA